MRTKHTPGPWTTDENEHDEPDQDIKIMAGLGTVCEVWIDDASVRDCNAEYRANARLIAAAPELLEALQECMADAEGYEERSGKKLAGGWPEKARAAIAKATGATA